MEDTALQLHLALSWALVLGYTSSQPNLHTGFSSTYRQKDQSDVSGTKGI